MRLYQTSLQFGQTMAGGSKTFLAESHLDCRFYFTVSGSLIHVHSSTPPSFERLSTIGTGPNGHTKNITALVPHPTNAMQIVTSAEDGTVKVWDWVEGRLVRTLTFAENGKVWQIALGLVGSKWFVFATVGVPKQNHDPSKQGQSFYLAQLIHPYIRLRVLSTLPCTKNTSDTSNTGGTCSTVCRR